MTTAAWASERGVASEGSLLSAFPDEFAVTAGKVAGVRRSSRRTLAVLDHGPRGTQSVADLPVLRRWEQENLAWALRLKLDAFYAQANSRNLLATDVVAAELWPTSSCGRRSRRRSSASREEVKGGGLTSRCLEPGRRNECSQRLIGDRCVPDQT